MAVLLYPFFFFFAVFPEPGLMYAYVTNIWFLVFEIFYLATNRNLVFQGGLLVSQILFYVSLGILPVFVARGLLRMRNWARKATMLYTVLYFIFAPIYLISLFIPAFTPSLFNINLFALLHHFLSFDPFMRGCGPLVIHLMFIISVFFLAIPCYLSGNIKYEFE
ncbi:MAG: hypothetical protein QXK32_03595 [Candidatus Jordarchaeales archaeon]